MSDIGFAPRVIGYLQKGLYVASGGLVRLGPTDDIYDGGDFKLSMTYFYRCGASVMLTLFGAFIITVITSKLLGYTELTVNAVTSLVFVLSLIVGGAPFYYWDRWYFKQPKKARYKDSAYRAVFCLLLLCAMIIAA